MTDQKSSRTPKDTHYANLRRQFRDQKAGTVGKGPAGKGPAGKPQRPQRPATDATPVPEGLIRLYGLHTVRAALDNPARQIRRMLVTRNALDRLEIADVGALPFAVEIVEPRAIDRETGSEAVHQGVMIEARPLKTHSLKALQDSSLLLILDQVTDPHNVGAIMRSAVAFGAGAIITTARHSPQESGVLAKAASGALELIPHIEVRNLADAIGELHDLGFVTIGLDSEGPLELEQTMTPGRIALVLGAEGKGLRQKTRETVSHLARLDMPGAIKSLNVSNAAAISLYAAQRFLAAGSQAA
ncbi:23S rRNA (guanosine(2251)-2'-O)-methyltransferase RlmB [Phyllobacterium sp. 0TCS1.6C]|uniref:23S rRNA (guanosine(2251)-2'-O)-methyltransferase RlmB n=1 Tax=unclassified Phyllobacterium TaxID=2638441 RepID=UPI002265582E|nr:MULTISPECIES: 23S rRNA (guanosine(2251)-2'-O)-methyltransferase RlmB [unclassified Phyllobacterium]MCX8281609.1 23S rRNA (guanosine(2251)-2'-O)-methyltransferase RlmB [Phyllobacterium sp. 0TCS1.6C]MCX8294719.1 23S rRNA (guanosine(2251)-2'-O)-methyltransferase RlmB [Phyllobacterium sp. 0TCS1.6A]